jgi:hypothetical protein
MRTIPILLCVAGAVLSPLSARANVYATDIKLNGSSASVSVPAASPLTISYRLNQAATLGVTVAIWQGTNQVATISGGSTMGLNKVVWGGTNNSGVAVGTGTYSVSITAAASGFATWQQISEDTNAGNYAFDPNGMAVDNNTNSPFYGRVVLGCSSVGGVNPISGAAVQDGIYKMNADGSFADEGGFGFGGYTTDDGGNTGVNEMPSTSTLVPWRLRIGDDDRIYMLDFSDEGAIVAFDMQVTTNQVVIDDGGFDGGALGGPHNYSGNPDIDNLLYGIGNFDVTSTTTSDAAVWLCDDDTNGNWGIWMYHLKNGQSDPSDTEGTQAVTIGGDLAQGSTGGCMVDTNLDIFVSQSQLDSGDPALRTMDFANWNKGVLPPEAGGFTYALGTTKGEVVWGVGASDNTDAGVMDTVLDSRTHPTYVATPLDDASGTATNLAGFDSLNGGIRVLNASNGAVVSVTNGSGVVIQALSNLDVGNWYTCAAWDNVGNLYGGSPTTNRWRVWSPPGANTNTTVALAQVSISISFRISSIAAVPTGSGCANVTIDFTAPGDLAPTAFTLLGSSAVNGPYAAVAGAVITGGPVAYQATFSNCSTEFYQIEQPAD